ncbi:MAG: undecaprenyl-diphosphate phosphatase [Patescibacteria group bacterium]
MDIFQSVVLGAIQGITEFLPISSSGHLVLFQKFFNLKEPPIFFDTTVHAATLLAVVFYFRKDIFEIVFNIKKNAKLIFYLALGTLPAAAFGLLFKSQIEKSFNSVFLLSTGFFITAVIIFITKFYKKTGKSIEQLNWLDSLIVGIFQAVSILPSISRSGATISSAIFMGADRNTAFKFSFLLAVPAIFGAMVLQIFDINEVSQNELLASVAGFLPAMIFGFLSLKFLGKYMANDKFSLFAYYCLFLGFISLLLV